MKSLFFDAGPIITLVMSRLGWLLPELKKAFGGKFYITPAVEYELVQRPLTIRRFQFEALQVMRWISDGTLTVYNQVPTSSKKISRSANSIFRCKNKNMDILQAGEVESLASAATEKAVIVMDERTLRLLIEDPQSLRELLMHRFHAPVIYDKEKREAFCTLFSPPKIIRSTELIGVAYKLGLLDSYIPKQRDGRKLLLNAVLWAARYNGAAINEHEIEELKEVLLH